MVRHSRTFLAALFVSLLGLSRAHAADTDLGMWKVERFDQPHVCDVAGPISGRAELAIAVMGPEFKLIISSDDFHLASATYPVFISIDGGPKVAMNALGDGGVYAVALVPALGMALRSASVLTVTIGNATYQFSVARADAAMDAASSCAGEPSYPESFAHPPQPIAGAGDWKLVDDPRNGNRCSLRRNGPEIDTMLTRNRDGQFILIGGRGDWANPTGHTKITLQLGDASPQELEASIFDNLVLVAIKDPAMSDRLVHATSLGWHMPWGDFHADLTGLGVATEALRVCNSKKAGSQAN